MLDSIVKNIKDSAIMLSKSWESNSLMISRDNKRLMTNPKTAKHKATKDTW